MPVYMHDCQKCIFLGTLKPLSSDGEKEIDCYICIKSNINLSSIIGRYGNEGYQYVSSHPYHAFAGGDEYLLLADRYYLYSIIQAARLGLITLDKIKNLSVAFQ